jgi:hypothetical protein
LKEESRLEKEKEGKRVSRQMIESTKPEQLGLGWGVRPWGEGV